MGRLIAYLLGSLFLAMGFQGAPPPAAGAFISSDGGTTWSAWTAASGAGALAAAPPGMAMYCQASPPNGPWTPCTPSSGGSGTVTNIATTAPLGGGPITTTGTLTCATCIVASSPVAGVAHFAGATQTVTSSTIATGDIAANAVTLAKLATQAADTVLQNASGSTAVPSAVAIPNCSGGVNYSTATHTWSCVTFSYWGIPGPYNGSTPVGPQANQLFIIGIPYAPALAGINHLVFRIETADATNNSAVCIYNANGTLALHTAPATYASTGEQTISTVETNGSVTAGKIYVGMTSVAATIRFGGIQNFPQAFYSNNTFTSTAGGACPASITPPTDAWVSAVNPVALGFAP